MKHSLTEKDVDARRGVCSIDGAVKIQRAGNGWTCSVRANAQSRKQKAADPHRDRTSRTEHLLEWRDGQTRTGVCRKCGPVDIVPWGRGYACGPRAKELGRVNNQDAPQEWCRDCWAETAEDRNRLKVWLLADGSCPRCSTGQDLHAELRAMEYHADTMAGAGLGPGFHLEMGDPYAMPEYESAVPGWKTLG